MSNRIYPSNYFDPYQDSPKAQCTECANWFEAGEISEVEEVTCLEFGIINQGICLDCKENKEQPDSIIQQLLSSTL